MKQLAESLALSGYSQEEAYFYELNQKLIERIRGQRPRRGDVARRLERIRSGSEKKSEKAKA